MKKKKYYYGPNLDIADPRDKDKYPKSTREIRKELAILINKTIEENPEVSANGIVDDCRMIINKKYGKGWRFQHVEL